MHELHKTLAQDTFSNHCGIELLEIEPGYAKAQMKIEPHHLNSIGTVHGAAIFALADLTYSAAANSRGNIAVLINAHISYCSKATEGTLHAKATEDAFHPKIASYRVVIKNDSDETLAVFQGTAYRKKEKQKLH